MGRLIELEQKEGILSLKATVDTTGAWVTRFTNFNDNIFYPRQQVVERFGSDIKTRGGMHVCSPYFGIPYQVGEQSLPQHGYSRDVAWEDITDHYSEVWEPGEACVLQHTQEEGPFAGLGQQILYALSEDVLIAELTMRNGSNKPIVVAPGFHPYFYQVRNRSVVNEEAVEHRPVPGYSNNIRSFTIGPGLPLTDEGREDWEYEYRVHISDTGLPITVEWTDAIADYFCVEPSMAGLSLDVGKGARPLEPGEVMEVGTYISVEA